MADHDYTDISKLGQNTKQYILQSKFVLVLLVKPRVDSDLSFTHGSDKFNKRSFDQIVLSTHELLTTDVQNWIRDVFTLKQPHLWIFSLLSFLTH